MSQWQILGLKVNGTAVLHDTLVLGTSRPLKRPDYTLQMVIVKFRKTTIDWEAESKKTVIRQFYFIIYEYALVYFP